MYFTHLFFLDYFQWFTIMIEEHQLDMIGFEVHHNILYQAICMIFPRMFLVIRFHNISFFVVH